MTGQDTKTKTILVALTGGIGSGKTTALHMFAARGAAVLDADKVVHEILGRPEVGREVAACLGIEDLKPGYEGRQQIANVVFADQEKLFGLEETIFPLVRREIERWKSSDEARGHPLAIVEAPMVFEAAMEDLFDAIVLVTAPEEVRGDRHARIVGQADFERRSRRQLPEEEKEKRSDFVYSNTGSPDELDEFVCETIAALLARD